MLQGETAGCGSVEDSGSSVAVKMRQPDVDRRWTGCAGCYMCTRRTNGEGLFTLCQLYLFM